MKNPNLPDTESEWARLSYSQKNHELFLKEIALLDTFLEHGAISREQHDKSLHDLIEKMGMEAGDDTDAE